MQNQTIIYVEKDNFDSIYELLEHGWKIKQISACSGESKYSGYNIPGCYVFMENITGNIICD